jgi:hypothetical protein
MCRMTVQVRKGRHNTHDKSVEVALPSQRAGELEGIAFTTTEEAFGAERRWGYVKDPNAVRLLANAGKP